MHKHSHMHEYMNVSAFRSSLAAACTWMATAGKRRASRYIDIEDMDPHISVAISVQAIVFFSHVLAMGFSCDDEKFLPVWT